MARRDRLEALALQAAREAVGESGCIWAVDWVAEAGDLQSWSRYARVAGGQEPWPTERDVADAVVVRLNKARDATDFAVAAALQLLKTGGALFLFGYNDEGVRATQRAAGQEFVTVTAGGHGRVLRAPSVAVVRPRNLLDFRETGQLTLPTQATRSWVWYPGCFSVGRLDAGTALLLGTLGDGVAPARVLDFATGTGPIAAAAHARWPQAVVVGSDVDVVAVAAARENVPGCSFVVAEGIAGLAEAGVRGPFDLVLSNPPFHVGRARDDGAWRPFLEGIARFLAPGGEVRIVVQREVQAEPVLNRWFDRVECVAREGGFVVWSAASPRRAPSGDTGRRR